jgi:hypothetical protein
VVPVVEFRGTDEGAKGAKWKANVGMNVDGPDAAKGQKPGEGFERETEEKGGEVDDGHGVDGVERVLAVRCQPVEMLRAVMDGMESPEEGILMLETVCPVDEEITE